PAPALLRMPPSGSTLGPVALTSRSSIRCSTSHEGVFMSHRPRVLRLTSLATAGVMLGAGLVGIGGAAHAADPWDPAPSYTPTDAGDGTYTVPHMSSDVPDVSVDMVPAAENDEGRDIYYKIST